jgi:hypothetical protein
VELETPERAQEEPGVACRNSLERRWPEVPKLMMIQSQRTWHILQNRMQSPRRLGQISVRIE